MFKRFEQAGTKKYRALRICFSNIIIVVFAPLIGIGMSYCTKTWSIFPKNKQNCTNAWRHPSVLFQFSIARRQEINEKYHSRSRCWWQGLIGQGWDWSRMSPELKNDCARARSMQTIWRKIPVTGAISGLMLKLCKKAWLESHGNKCYNIQLFDKRLTVLLEFNKNKRAAIIRNE